MFRVGLEVSSLPVLEDVEVRTPDNSGYATLSSLG